MRLIDADRFLEYMTDKCDMSAELDPIILGIFRGALKEQPTAYSVDKVVEELEIERKTANNTYNSFNMDVDLGRVFGLEKAIEIVKQVGVSDDVCEWKVFDNSLTDEPQWVYETTCGKYAGEEHTSKAFAYCPCCGKKIKIVGD